MYDQTSQVVKSHSLAVRNFFCFLSNWPYVIRFGSSPPPPHGFLKADYDMAVRHSVAVAAVISDSNGNVVSAVSSKAPSLDVNGADEAKAALLAVNFGLSYGCRTLIL